MQTIINSRSLKSTNFHRQSQNSASLSNDAASVVRRCRRSVGLRPMLRIACLARSGALHSPDLQEEAVKTVLAQAELLCAE